MICFLIAHNLLDFTLHCCQLFPTVIIPFNNLLLVIHVPSSLSRFISSSLRTLHAFHTSSSQPMFSEPAIHQRLILIQEALKGMPNFPKGIPPVTDPLSHLQNFFTNELACYTNLVATIQSDVGLLLHAASGLVALTPDVQTMLSALRDDSVPRSWLPDHIATYAGIQGWLAAVKRNMTTLRGLCQEEMTGEEAKAPEKPCCFNLALFWNPKSFIKSLLQEHARREYIEVYKLLLEAQVRDLAILESLKVWFIILLLHSTHSP